MGIVSLCRKHQLSLVLACSIGCFLASGYFFFWHGASPVDAKPVANKQRDDSSTLKRIGNRYDVLLARHKDATYDDVAAAYPKRSPYLKKLSFDPTKARYFDLVRHRLKLSKDEIARYTRNGYVAIDQGQLQSFPAAYQQVYTSDLPVFITTDSILHALHRSYDALLMELETWHFRWTISEVLAECHAELKKLAKSAPPELRPSLQDVDLYLSVAQKLLNNDRMAEYLLKKKKLQYSVLGQQRKVDELVQKISSLQLQTGPALTEIYGGKRRMDFSQFRPRGHYTRTGALKAYFRCVMWLGRADCGWTVYPKSSESSENSVRQLRNAAILTHLLHKTGQDKRLQQVDDVIRMLVGPSDNLNPWDLHRIMGKAGIARPADLRDPKVVRELQGKLAKGEFGTQLIRSQVVYPKPGEAKAVVPSLFQLFGQRFVIDSFVLSKVVHDEIVFRGRKMPRMMPTGLDVMAAFGNPTAVPLLKDELERWNYGANLIAAKTLVGELDKQFWNSSTTNIWLDSLRTLDDDFPKTANVPEVMRTRLWQRKQLQTQLASWSELRHDNILYAKQSYSVPGCAFPDGYVEPYPAFYRKLRRFAESAIKLFSTVRLTSTNKNLKQYLAKASKTQLTYFVEMAATMRMLEDISIGELNGKPLTKTQKKFLKSTFDHLGSIRFGSASKPDYNGWYCRLYYERTQRPSLWEPLKPMPTIADVHTDPQNHRVLEVGVGGPNLAIIAVNRGKDVAAYVGPVFSYYEFRHPVSNRLTDEEWTKMIKAGNQPARPEWARELVGNQVVRKQREVRVRLKRGLKRGTDYLSGNGEGARVSIDNTLLKRLANHTRLPSLDVSSSPVSDEGLTHLKPLVDLRSLNLSHTLVTDAGMKHVAAHKRLQFLDLSHTAITDKALEQLHALKNLSVIDIGRTKVTAAGVKAFNKKLPHTQIIMDRAIRQSYIRRK